MKSSTKKINQLLGDRAALMVGPKSRRMHIYVDDITYNKIISESKNTGLTFSDYISYIALTFDVKCAHKKITKTLIFLDQYLKNNNIEYIYKGDNIMKKGNAVQSSVEKISSEKKQFHLRVPQDVYDEIEKRAARQGMTVSNYIVFVTTQFDIIDISKKIDEINNKLDTIMLK